MFILFSAICTEVMFLLFGSSWLLLTLLHSWMTSSDNMNTRQMWYLDLTVFNCLIIRINLYLKGWCVKVILRKTTPKFLSHMHHWLLTKNHFWGPLIGNRDSERMKHGSHVVPHFKRAGLKSSNYELPEHRTCKKATRLMQDYHSFCT